MDAVKAFAFLTDNIPVWLEQLETLHQKCEQHYERMSQHVAPVLPAKHKNASTESLRPERDDTGRVAAQTGTGTDLRPPSAEATAAVQPLEAATGPEAATGLRGQRKRPADSELSGPPSNHYRPRTKNMVVVYYDSEIQNQFESLVKHISTARNNLRKGKNASAFKNRLASMTMGPSAAEKPSETGTMGLDSKMMKASLARARMSRTSTSGELKCFEDADRDLEEAQSFCEKGAHQCLREGRCQSEVEGTKRRLGMCERVAKLNLERLKEEAERMREQESPPEEQAEEKTLVGDCTPPFAEKEDTSMDATIANKMGPPPVRAVKFAGVGAIEIDDASSNSDSIEIDLSAIRRTAVRSTRF